MKDLTQYKEELKKDPTLFVEHMQKLSTLLQECAPGFMCLVVAWFNGDTHVFPKGMPVQVVTVAPPREGMVH